MEQATSQNCGGFGIDCALALHICCQSATKEGTGDIKFTKENKHDKNDLTNYAQK